jgi:hypothetical protein
MKIFEKYIPYSDFDWTIINNHKTYTTTTFDADNIINVQLKESLDSQWIYQLGFHYKKPTNRLLINIPPSLPGLNSSLKDQFIYITYNSLSEEREEKLSEIL